MPHPGIDQAAVVGHDIGTVVAYADAGNYLTKTDKVVMAGRP